MKIRFYLDEDSMYHDLAEALRLRNVDVKTSTEAGMDGKPDVEQLEFATFENRVLFSFNISDYQQLHAYFLSFGQEHAGILLARQQQYSIGELLKRMMRLVTLVAAEEMRNRLEFMSACGEK